MIINLKRSFFLQTTLIENTKLYFMRLKYKKKGGCCIMKEDFYSLLGITNNSTDYEMPLQNIVQCDYVVCTLGI